ncbi:damage-inducible protein CinA, partial [Mycobacterium tuberculosis]
MTVPSDADLGALASDVGQRLQKASLQLVTAESCSGGWIAKAMTDIAGSSAFFDCGMVVYSYEAKQRLLG